jgi:hypothetical protein
LREEVHPYAIFSPNVSVLNAGTLNKERVVRFSGYPRRVVRILEKRTVGFVGLCNGFFKTYALIPC